MEQKKMKTLEEYLEAYEKAVPMTESVETRMIFTPEVWIYFKWTEDEEIEDLNEPRHKEKLEALWRTNPRLASVIVAGVERMGEMMSFLGFKVEEVWKQTRESK